MDINKYLGLRNVVILVKILRDISINKTMDRCLRKTAKSEIRQTCVQPHFQLLVGRTSYLR